MENLFKVNIQPVGYKDRKSVETIIIRMLGPDSRDEVQKLLEDGGTIFKGLNEEAANNLASQLRKAGAEVEVIPLEDDQERKQKLFRVNLVSIGEKKIHVIKEIRKITGLGLKESKELVDNLGIVQDGVSHEAALKTKAMLKDAGATVTLEPIGEPNQSDEFVVHGKVKLPNGEPAGSLLVRVYDRDLRSMENLGEATTQNDGKYLIKYSREDFAMSENLRADLVLQVYNEVGVQLQVESDREKTIFNAEQEEKVNLQIAEGEPFIPSEYERLVSLITPILDGAALSSLTYEEVEFLIHESEIKEFEEEFPAGADSLAFLSESSKLAVQTGIQIEAFYGWARLEAGLISTSDQINIDTTELLEKNNDELIDILQSAIESIIISNIKQDQFQSIADLLNSLRNEKAFKERQDWKTYEIKGKLLSAEDEEPLTKYNITLKDLNAEAVFHNLGTKVSNLEGNFSFEMQVPDDESDQPREIELTVTAPSDDEIYRKTDSIVPDSDDVYTLTVTVPEPKLPGEDIAVSDLPLQLSDELKEVLESNGIKNMAHLMKKGGVAKLSDVTDGLRDSEEVKQLQGFAHLALLSPDLESEVKIRQSQTLMTHGYFSPHDIADESLADFQTNLSEELSAEHLVQLYNVGKAQSFLLDNYAVDRLTNYRSLGETEDADEDAAQQDPRLSCSCKDCQSAVSPGAYLTDLVGYVTKHVWNTDTNKKIDLDFLVDTFHHPLKELPINCAATKDEVRQVRIAIEVLYKSVESQLNTLQYTEGLEKYVQSSYKALLRETGTSLRDLQRASSEEEKEKIADRIGIAVQYVDRLYLQETTQDPSNLLSENNLERIFGLPAFLNIDDGSVTLNDPLRFLKDEGDEPLLYKWRLEHLQEQWRYLDFPEDDYSEGIIPIIDPDLIGPDDFRDPSTTDKNFSLWLKRRTWLDEKLNDFWTLIDPQAPDTSFDKILSKIQEDFSYTPEGGQAENLKPWSEATNQALLLEKQKEFSADNDIEAVKTWLEKRHLTYESFTALGKIASELPTEDKEKNETWNVAIDILTQSLKKAFYPIWVQEETEGQIELDPRSFWDSLTEPKEGNWSVLIENERPLIDPEIVEQRELPDGVVGENARELWQQRKNELSDKKEDFLSLLQTDEDDRLISALQLALNDPPVVPNADTTWTSAIDELNKQQQSLDVDEQKEAKRIINEVLYFDDNTFLRLVRFKDQVTDPDIKPDKDVIEKIATDLTIAHKQKTFYTDWSQEESNQDIMYWKAYKARLPKWRGSLEARFAWKYALDTRSRAPIINPDIVPGEAIAEPVPGEKAFDLWRKRNLEVDQKLQNLKSFDVSTRDGVSNLFNEVLGITFDELLTLGHTEKQGQRIDARLNQLTLTREAYWLLLEVGQRIDDDKTVLDDTWKSVRAILLQVWKKRQFAEWHKEEKGGVSLSPELFRVTSSSQLTTTDDAPEMSWRKDVRRQREWQRTLRSRLDQQNALSSSLKEVISSVEEEILPELRDVLIDLTDTSQDTLSVKADRLSERFLIDMKNSGCRSTTRVGIVLEVLQSLINSIKRGKLGLDNPKLKLNAIHFDEEWRWLGSYATWKAAMSVFLYPDMLLHPSLRREATPLFSELSNALAEKATPTSICKIALDYTDYLKDLITLKPIASCYAEANIGSGGECQQRTSEKRLLHFVFAKGGHTSSYYWSTMQPFGHNDYSQSIWKRIPISESNNIERMVGAAYYDQGLSSVFPDQSITQIIYVFFERREEGSYNIENVYAKFDLNKYKWIEEDGNIVLENIELPDELDSAYATIVQWHSYKPAVLLKNSYSTYFSVFDGSEWSHKKLVGSSSVIRNIFQNNVKDVNVSKSTIYSAQYVNQSFQDKSLRVLNVSVIPYTSSITKQKYINVVFHEITRLEESAGWITEMVQVGAYEMLSTNDGELTPKCTFIESVDSGHIFHSLLEYNGSIYHHALEFSGNNGKRFYLGKLNDFFKYDVFFSQPNQRFRSLAFTIIHKDKELHKGEEQFYSSFYVNFETRYNDKLIKLKLRDGWETRLISLKGHPDKAPEIISREKFDPTNISDRLNQIIKLYNLNKPGENHPNRNTGRHNIYLDEAYFFLPLQIGLSLYKNKYYDESLYWYRSIFDYYLEGRNRRLAFQLYKESESSMTYGLTNDWLKDPINPHSIYRTNKYTLFVIQSILRSLLDYADSEFSLDTSESLVRARNLYKLAIELLESENLIPQANQCEKLINDLNYSVENKALEPFWKHIKSKLGHIQNVEILQTTINRITDELSKYEPEESRLLNSYSYLMNDIGVIKISKELSKILSESKISRTYLSEKLVSETAVSSNLHKIGRLAPMINSTTNTDSELEFNPVKPAFDAVLIGHKPQLSYSFCIPNNPTTRFLKLRADLNLFKIRNCMNIAGMRRELTPYAAPIDVESALPSIGAGGQINLPGTYQIRPTQYRYNVLVERARQLASLAQQTESSFLGAIQSKDQEDYSLLIAKQNVQTAKAGIKLQDLRLREAENGVELSELQLERSSILKETYGQWLSEGMLAQEKALLNAYSQLEGAQIDAANWRYLGQSAQAFVSASSADWKSAAAAFSAYAVALATAQSEFISNTNVIRAKGKVNEIALDLSIELRNRGYELQHKISNQDMAISKQQITLAEDRVDIVEQEREIAELQTEQAEDAVHFLQNKFTSAELYDWMSGVLERIFRYFLQQGASMAKLAENQLAFERQEALMGVIQNDYYELVSKNGSSFGNTNDSDIDRRGLTGSARLLRDITKLDQYAFTTDERKQQLGMTFSLAQLDPFAFQQFRQTGVLTFETPMEHFDRRFPGQFMRLIKRVRTSVIALVPPKDGISATLSSSGISRVVTGGDIYQTRIIRRDPETIAFSTPIGATGVFELDPNPGMLLPFEGNGVDTRWEFRMPKASNAMDFSTIADVLITIEYTALHDFTYQQKIQSELDPYISADRAFSFRQQFSDAWYDLNNPNLSSTPMRVKFYTRRGDFPPNMNDVSISQILLYFVSDEELPEALAAELIFTHDGVGLGGEAVPIDGVVSTRRGNGSSWLPILGQVPQGEWELSLTNSPRIINLFKEEKIQDILFVITYSGQNPEWSE